MLGEEGFVGGMVDLEGGEIIFLFYGIWHLVVYPFFLVFRAHYEAGYNFYIG